MRRMITLVAMAVIACGASEPMNGSGHRYVNREQGYSVEQPDAWVESADRGSMRFAPASGRRSITIRSATRPGAVGSVAVANEQLVTQTRIALGALPQAIIGPESKLEAAELPGSTFVVRFRPSGAREMYRRTHVVLIGTRHIFHVIATAPEPETIDEDALKTMALTLREED